MNKTRIEAEQALLGSLLLNPRSYMKLISFRVEFFATKRAKKLFLCILQLIADKQPFDYVVVANALGEEITSVILYMEECKNSCISSENINTVAQILKDFAVKEKLYLYAKELQESIQKGQSGLVVQKDAIDKVKEIYQWADVTPDDPALDSFVKYTQDLAEEKDRLKEGSTELGYGIDKIDEELVGIQRGAYVVIGAEQGSGKTLVGLHIALHNANKKLKVKFYCTDMTRNEIMQRIAGNVMDTNISAFFPKNITDTLLFKMGEVEKKLAVSNLFFSFDTALTIEDIQQDVIGTALTEPYDLVIVDYLQNVKSSNTKLNRWEVITKVTNTLRDLAKQYGTPVIALAQINREGKKKMGTKPEVHHLEGGASIEQTATQIILLYRDPEDDRHQRGKGLDLLIRKNRIGESRVDVPVLADFAKMQIHNSINF